MCLSKFIHVTLPPVSAQANYVENSTEEIAIKTDHEEEAKMLKRCATAVLSQFARKAADVE